MKCLEICDKQLLLVQDALVSDKAIIRNVTSPLLQLLGLWLDQKTL